MPKRPAAEKIMNDYPDDIAAPALRRYFAAKAGVAIPELYEMCMNAAWGAYKSGYQPESFKVLLKQAIESLNLINVAVTNLIRCAQYDAVKSMQAMGIKLDAAEPKSGDTALFGARGASAKALIEAGCDVRKQNVNGDMPIHVSCNVDAVRAMVAHDPALIWEKNRIGLTPFEKGLGGFSNRLTSWVCLHAMCQQYREKPGALYEYLDHRRVFLNSIESDPAEPGLGGFLGKLGFISSAELKSDGGNEDTYGLFEGTEYGASDVSNPDSARGYHLARLKNFEIVMEALFEPGFPKRFRPVILDVMDKTDMIAINLSFETGELDPPAAPPAEGAYWEERAPVYEYEDETPYL